MGKTTDQTSVKVLSVDDLDQFDEFSEHVEDALAMAALHIQKYPDNEAARVITITIRATPLKKKEGSTTVDGHRRVEIAHGVKLGFPKIGSTGMTTRLDSRANQACFTFNPGTGSDDLEQTTLT